MRIAMLAHGQVIRDARILKEARTLSGAGHEVEIHGMSAGDRAGEQTLPGTNVRVIMNAKPKQVPHQLWLPLKPGIAIAALTLICSAYSFLILHLAHFIGLYDALSIVLLANFLIATFVYWKRREISNASRYFSEATIGAITGAVRALKRLVLRSPLRAHLHVRRYELTADTLCRSLASRPAPDVVHIHDHVALLASPFIKQQYGCPVVWDAHEIYEDLASGDRSQGQLNATLIRNNSRHIDYFITINDSIAKFYADHHPALPTATILMNATIAAPRPTYDGRLHGAAGLPLSQKIVLFQGGLGPKRGLHALVESAALLDDGWTLVLMGWGSLEDELRKLADKAVPHRDVPRVVFLPGVPQEDLIYWSSGASLGIIPYENVGLNHLYCTPNKLWEYPVAGVPLLCTDLEEMGRIVRENNIGFLLPRSFTATDIAEHTNALTAEELDAARNACSRFLATNSWECFAPKLIALYDQAAQAIDTARQRAQIAIQKSPASQRPEKQSAAPPTRASVAAH